MKVSKKMAQVRQYRTRGEAGSSEGATPPLRPSALMAPRYYPKLALSPREPQPYDCWLGQKIEMDGWTGKAQEQSAGPVIAMLGTGGDLSHPELSPYIWVDPERTSSRRVDANRGESVLDMHAFNAANPGEPALADSCSAAIEFDKHVLVTLLSAGGSLSEEVLEKLSPLPNIEKKAIPEMIEPSHEVSRKIEPGLEGVVLRPVVENVVELTAINACNLLNLHTRARNDRSLNCTNTSVALAHCLNGKETLALPKAEGEDAEEFISYLESTFGNKYRDYGTQEELLDAAREWGPNTHGIAMAWWPWKVGAHVFNVVTDSKSRPYLVDPQRGNFTDVYPYVSDSFSMIRAGPSKYPLRVSVYRGHDDNESYRIGLPEDDQRFAIDSAAQQKSSLLAEEIALRGPLPPEVRSS